MERIPKEVVGAAGAAGGSSGESPAKVNKATSNFVQAMAEKVNSMTERRRRRNTAEVKYQMKALSVQCDENAAGATASSSASWEDSNGKPKQSQRKKYKVNVHLENLKNIMKSEKARRADSGKMQKLIENNQPLDGKKMSTEVEVVGGAGGGGGELDSERRQNDSGEGEATTADSAGDGGGDDAAEKPPSGFWDLLDESDRMLDDLINRSNPGNRAVVAPTERAFLEGGAVLQNLDFGFGSSPFAFPFETEPQISMDPNGGVDN